LESHQLVRFKGKSLLQHQESYKIWIGQVKARVLKALCTLD